MNNSKHRGRSNTLTAYFLQAGKTQDSDVTGFPASTVCLLYLWSQSDILLQEERERENWPIFEVYKAWNFVRLHFIRLVRQSCEIRQLHLYKGVNSLPNKRPYYITKPFDSEALVLQRLVMWSTSTLLLHSGTV